MPTHVVLLRGVNNLGGKRVAMAELREVVASLGHADVMTYIQSGNVLFTARPAGARTAARTGTGPLAAELEQAITASTGVRTRAGVLSREELARCVHDNPYPGETNPRLLHAVFLPEVPGPGLAAWVAGAERQVQANGSQDEAKLLGRAVYLHTPDGYPRSELRRRLARAGGPTSAAVAGTARNWATILVVTCGLWARPRTRSASTPRTLLVRSRLLSYDFATGKPVPGTATFSAPHIRLFEQQAAELGLTIAAPPSSPPA